MSEPITLEEWLLSATKNQTEHLMGVLAFTVEVKPETTVLDFVKETKAFIEKHQIN